MTTAEERLPESTRIASWLRDAILDGERAPGSRLIERDLASEFGVSRVPVREALKVLVAEGLVELRPHTWAIVREFTEADLADLDEVRTVLEPLAFRLAAERHRRDGLARLQESLELEQSSALAGEGVAARRAAADFHEIVTDLTENMLLGDMMRAIRSRLRWALSQHDDLQHVSAEHVELFDAIRLRDGDRAAELAAAHVDSSRLERIAHVEAQRTGAVRTTALDGPDPIDR
ncbi:GntR family transcriptional regulator [Microbacterium sp. ASV81]|uniref:GntR family transcriptional regulator n=1 Tax=Microbacterium capsulatum TaxID=3041921 RepID=A0ABU0XJX6_9MICO|nr:GntR family transcriptional regulator [Microbacterium sp. ASV81]MDQ4215431.1 GntR family transcriptional regulator [Microbacterium sp. ASV81]